jgi:anti-sigma regulatory factor (Ser/Thr protein kinase)
MGDWPRVLRKPWSLPFEAEPEEVAVLRGIMRLHLRLWGLHEIADAAQLCMSELVSNVITHVGTGTPTTLAVAMNGTCLRIEVHDPDVHSVPTLTQPEFDCETGRGMSLVAGVASRWGVELRPDRKVAWCELETDAGRHDLRSRELTPSGTSKGAGSLGMALVEQAAVDIIAGVLQCLDAHGRDPDELLDRAQAHFEAEAARCGAPEG